MTSQIEYIPAVNAAGAPAPPSPVSYEEFLAWVDEDTRAEWVDGEVIMASPANYIHQSILGWFYRILSLFARAQQLGEVVPMGYNMKITRAGREPDVLFVRADHRDRIEHTFLNGPADLVIEVVSPESVERDYITKLGEYNDRDVGEYWLVDPMSLVQRFYQRDSQGQLSPVTPIDGIIESSTMPGFRLPVEWIWDPPGDFEVLEWMKLGVSYDKWLAVQEQVNAERARADAEEARADAASQRAERLEKLLRERGLDLD